MRKFKTKMTNAIDPAKHNTVKLTHLKNNTTNYSIPPSIFERECKEYDAGILPFEHERYIGD